MANDPPTPSTPLTAEQVQLMEQATTAQKSLSESTKGYGEIVNGVTGFLGQLRTTLTNVGNELQGVDKLTERGKAAFLGFGVSAIKAQESFKGFANMDMSKVSTFGGQLGELKTMLDSGGTAADRAKDYIASLGAAFTKSGGSQSAWNMAIKAGSGAALDLVKNMFNAADVAVKMQESQLKMASSTGSLDKMFEKAGGSLQNMTVLVDEQNKMMNLSMGATNTVSKDVMQEYYNNLGKIKGALTENVAGTSLLTATIQLAHGTGMDQVKITEDMHDAYKKFGMVGADSIRFVARFSELSNDLGVDLEDMRSGLLGATDAFKGMVDNGKSATTMTEGITSVMKEYVKGLQATGLNSKDAIAAATNMTSAFKGLNVAQRAFLSAQTGGPGGMMGSAKIEKMLRDGDIKGVEKLVMQSMQKQTGKAVTLEEASKSESAAATRQKQIMLLQQGPLGGLAKTPEDAGRLLEKMRADQEGRPTAGPAAELRTNGLEAAIKSGSTWEKQTHTVVADMATDLSAIRDQTATGSLNALKGALTSAATPGDRRREEKLTPDEKQSRKDLDERKDSFTRMGATHAQKMAGDMNQRGMVTDRGEQNMKETVGNLVHSSAAVPTAISRVGSVVKRAATSAFESDNEQAQDQLQNIRDEAKQRDSAKETTRAMAKEQMKVAPKPRTFKMPEMSSLDIKNFGQPVTSSAAVVASAQRGQPNQRKTPDANASRVTPEVVVNDEGATGRIKVEVKVTEVGSANSNAIAPAARTTP